MTGDLTLTSTHRAALRRIARAEPLADLDGTFDTLLEAGLVDVLPDSIALTDAGWRYLDASEQARTRRLPRPAPPTIPEGWTYCGGGVWEYSGRLTDGRVDLGDDEADPDELAQRLEAAEAEVAILRFLRARQAHTQREASFGLRSVEDGDASSAPPCRGDGTDMGGSGEQPHSQAVAP
jgi:hypothetical protein